LFIRLCIRFGFITAQADPGMPSFHVDSNW
jgi:hypothetical protein